MSYIVMKGPLDTSSVSAITQQVATSLTGSSDYVRTTTDGGRPADNFINAFRKDRETCKQWTGLQSMSKSYVDAYVVGSQKGATSEITKRLHLLRVRKDGMMKEWHCFNKIDENGDIVHGITTHLPILPHDLRAFRFTHYKTGFPNDTDATLENIPLIDNSDQSTRMLVYDSTVENLHTDKAAFLAHALTPHAKIVITIRNPIERALSQFNMVVRTYNKARRDEGKTEEPATPDWFHKTVTSEIERLTQCGYNAKTGDVDRPTSKILSCMFGDDKIKFENLLYITRGLYHVHINTWRNYFPDHRILILSFLDLTQGKKEVYQDLTRFLCIRPFSEELLKRFADDGSMLSYGQQAAAQNLSQHGSDSYEGNNKYMPDMWASTREMLEQFYVPANSRLEAMLGRKMF